MCQLFPLLLRLKVGAVSNSVFFRTAVNSLARSCCLRTSRQTVSNSGVLARTASVAMFAKKMLLVS